MASTFLNIISSTAVKEHLRLLYHLMVRGRSPEGEAMMGVQAGYLQQSQVHWHSLNLLSRCPAGTPTPNAFTRLAVFTFCRGSVQPWLGVTLVWDHRAGRVSAHRQGGARWAARHRGQGGIHVFFGVAARTGHSVCALLRVCAARTSIAKCTTMLR